MSGDEQGRMLRAALRYAALGWYVFPLRTDQDVKQPHPVLGEEGGHNKASIDPETIRAWWRRSPNAGIGLNLAKTGLIAPDIDPRAGGYETMARLEAEHGPVRAQVVNLTGGGGEHRLFLAPPGLRGAPGRIGPPKGGVDLKYNGYIVLPPSLWAKRRPDRTWEPPSNRYRWKDGADPFGESRGDWLTAIPAWCLRASETAALGEQDPDDMFRDATQVMGFTAEQMAADLALLPNSGDDELSYEDWLNVLAGIWHETEGSAEGHALALEWSERALKHDGEKFNKSWSSLNIEGKDRAPVTFRFVHKLAQERRRVVETATWKDFKQKISAAQEPGALKAVAAEIKQTALEPLLRNDLTNNVRARYKAVTGDLLPVGMAREMVKYEDPAAKDVPAWLAPWVYCAQDDRFYRKGTAEILTRSAFNGLHNVHMLSRQERLEGQAVPAVQASDAAQNRYEIPKVHGRMYLPGEDDVFTFQGSVWFNTYTEVSVPPVPETLTRDDRAAIELVERHFSMLIPDPRECALVKSYFAYIVQTLRRPNWAILLQGPEGNGKSFVGQMMGAILGSENVNILFAQTIQESPFNSWAEGALLTIIEEVKQHSQNRHIIMDRLQVMITNDVIEVHKKNQTPYNARNTTGFLLLTNHRDALPVTESDTRYFMASSGLQTTGDVAAFKAEHPNYFNDLWAALDNHTGALRHWLLNYPLHEEFSAKARAPYSAEHAHAVALSRPDYIDSIADVVRDAPTLCVSRLLLDTRCLTDWLVENEIVIPHTNGLRSCLVNLGFSYLGRFRINGTEPRRFWSASPSAFGDTDVERRAKIATFLDPANGL